MLEVKKPEVIKTLKRRRSCGPIVNYTEARDVCTPEDTWRPLPLSLWLFRAVVVVQHDSAAFK